MTVPFDQPQMQKAAKVLRRQGIGAAEANLAKRCFFVSAERCEHAPHRTLRRPAPTIGRIMRDRK